MALYPTTLTGKSNTPFHRKGGTKFLHRWVELKAVAANATFVLPAYVVLTGRIVIVNTSATTQAAITVGTVAAGTQVSAGAAVAAGLPSQIAGTLLNASNADRTIYVESAAWQTANEGVHVYLEAIEYPMIADRTAKQ